MGQPNREGGQRIFPGGTGEPFFGDGLPGDVQPDAFVGQDQPRPASNSLAMFEKVSDLARLQVAYAKGRAHAFRPLRGQGALMA
ncbi:hypothetical protein SDC9_212645 [bioreactor metagenome]|uniref:Uncharacterized protein n=1 Tax=bioreactor metagenome TaxID=1076179 RepID=A0A645JNE7_9ZZZZ